MIRENSNEAVLKKVRLREDIREGLRKLGYQSDPTLISCCEASIQGLHLDNKAAENYPVEYWVHTVIAEVWAVWHGPNYNIAEMIDLTDDDPTDYPYPTDDCSDGDMDLVVEDLTEEVGPDMVNHPPHYNQGSIETIDLMEFRYGTKAVITYCTLNVDKYLSRAPFKGNKEQDEEKAMWYHNKALELDKKFETGEAKDGILSFLGCKSCQ